MTTPTTYDLELGMMMKIVFPFILIFMVVVGAFGVVTAAQEDPRSALFFIVWYGMLAFIGVQMFSIPLHIDDHGDGSLTFRSSLRSRVVQVAQIRAIEPVPNQFGIFRVVHDGGKIVFLNQFTGFHRLVAQLIAQNPRIQLKGI